MNCYAVPWVFENGEKVVAFIPESIWEKTREWAEYARAECVRIRRPVPMFYERIAEKYTEPVWDDVNIEGAPDTAVLEVSGNGTVYLEFYDDVYVVGDALRRTFDWP